MSYFLWIEDFESNIETTAFDVFGGIHTEKFPNDKQQLRKLLKSKGIFLELSLQDGLDFIKQNLSKIDYVILDIDLIPYLEDDPINKNILNLLEKFHDCQISTDKSEIEQRQLLKNECAKLKTLAGYYLYTELIVEQGFPKQHILFCSNHGENTKDTQAAFKSAKIDLPPIYEKANPKVQQWVKERYDNPYSRLRRGIIEGCKTLKEFLTEDKAKISFNNWLQSDNQVNADEIKDYLNILENFLPLRKPDNTEALYKLFIRTLSHEWEAVDPKKVTITGLPWIMKNVRNWITHNSNLFNALDEQMVAYLFLVNMRVILNFDTNVQNYEDELLQLFNQDILAEDIFTSQLTNKLLPVSKIYLDLKNIILDERQDKAKKVQDGFYFNELANNLQQSNSIVRNDQQLFYKLLYQMFWLTTSNPYIGTGNRKNLLEIKFRNFDYKKDDYLFNLARHIYNPSFY